MHWFSYRVPGAHRDFREPQPLLKSVAMLFHVKEVAVSMFIMFTLGLLIVPITIIAPQHPANSC